MKRYWAMKWAKDLEAKGRRQTTGQLREGSSYCCLGRACVIAGMRPQDINAFSLPEEVVKKFGMNSEVGDLAYLPNGHSHLASMNDGGMTFREIAQIIRKRWKEL